MSLQQLGWSAFFQALWAEVRRPLRPARVISAAGDRFLVHDGSRELQATVRGWLREQANFPPVVGDWVGLSPADPSHPAADSEVIEEIIEEIIDRRTVIARKRPGKTFGAQVLAANIDRVVLVMALDQDFSLHRLERYLTLVWESGATPIIVLSKADLVGDPSGLVREAEERAMGFPVIPVSNITG
jgi:ribosome biogenesis GTPase / thiamine phosphate phosphatase